MNMNRQELAVKLGVLLLCAALVSACSKDATTGAETSAAAAAENAASGNEAILASAKIDWTTTSLVNFKDNDAYTDWKSETYTTVTLGGASATVDGEGAEASGGGVTITATGTYVVSGKLDDGQLTVDVPDKGDVRIVLNGAELHNETSAAIYVKEAGKVIMTLAEGTENTVSDGSVYTFPDETSDEPNAAIFSHDDLTINGAGKLTVQGNYNNGISSKDKLKITGGELDVTAVDDGVMGRDLVAVQAGDLTVDAGGHAIKTTNDTADEEGMIAISGGSFALTSGEDALHSKGGLQITGGEFAINAGDDGLHAELGLGIGGGTIAIAKSNEGIEAPIIQISGGDTSVVSDDDGVNVSGGTETFGEEGGAAPGDLEDLGVPSDDGAASGQEGQGGQRGPGGQGGRFGGGMPGESGADSGRMLTISGGTLTVDAKGDGLDSNGSIQMSGGTVLVNGPEETNNGALDYDGTFVMTGGFLVAAGSSGMAQATSDSSTQYGILMTYPQQQAAGTLVHLESADGDEVATFKPLHAYQSVFVASPDLKKDGSYVLYSGGTSSGGEQSGLYEGGSYSGGAKVVSFAIADVVTWLNESGVTEARSGMMGGGGGGRGRGGMGGDRGAMGNGGTPPQGDVPAPADGQQSDATDNA